jgi:hypothetical protein
MNDDETVENFTANAKQTPRALMLHSNDLGTSKKPAARDARTEGERAGRIISWVDKIVQSTTAGTGNNAHRQPPGDW